MDGFSSAFAYGHDVLAVATRPAGVGILGWLLAGIFALSGGLKLRRPILAAMAFVDFGVARRVIPVLGWSLGIGELLLAAALLAAPRLGGTAAAVLLWCFVGLIARSLRAGHHFACFCFGDGNAALSRWTLVRTAALALAATDLAFAAPNLITVGKEVPFEAVVAAGLLGLIALLGSLPRLVRWNADPFGEHVKEVPA